MSETTQDLDDLIARAKDAAQSSDDARVVALLLDLCRSMERLVTDQDEIRKDAFRDGIRGAAKVIRNRQAASGTALSELVSGEGGDPELFASELTKIADLGPVRINDLRKLRQKINTALVGNDDIDEDVKRIYYSIMRERTATSADILPPGSPSQSLDVATFVVEKVLRNGWWTLGNSGVNASDKPVGKVGLSPADDSKPQTAATTPLTLLSALVLTLIESSKSR